MSLICSSRSSELEMKRLCAFQSIRNNSEPPPPKNHFYLDPWGRWPCSRPVICFLVAVSCAEFRKSYFQQYRSYFLNFLNKMSSFPSFFCISDVFVPKTSARQAYKRSQRLREVCEALRKLSPTSVGNRLQRKSVCSQKMG